jgi:hypothetical protein
MCRIENEGRNMTPSKIFQTNKQKFLLRATNVTEESLKTVEVPSSLPVKKLALKNFNRFISLKTKAGTTPLSPLPLPAPQSPQKSRNQIPIISHAITQKLVKLL